MKRFKNILILTRNTPSDTHSLRRAAELAKRNKARLSLIEVIETPESEKEGSNRKIMELATSMAKIENGELHVIHVWDFVGESLLVKRGGLTREEVKDLVAETRQKHQTALDSLLKRHPAEDMPNFTYLLRGNPGEVIKAFAEEKHIDLIVMGTVGRAGIAGLLIGNTAEHVIQSVNASVLAVKPKGFTSPVQ